MVVLVVLVVVLVVVVMVMVMVVTAISTTPAAVLPPLPILCGNDQTNPPHCICRAALCSGRSPEPVAKTPLCTQDGLSPQSNTTALRKYHPYL